MKHNNLFSHVDISEIVKDKNKKLNMISFFRDNLVPKKKERINGMKQEANLYDIVETYNFLRHRIVYENITDIQLNTSYKAFEVIKEIREKRGL